MVLVFLWPRSCKKIDAKLGTPVVKLLRMQPCAFQQYIKLQNMWKFPTFSMDTRRARFAFISKSNIPGLNNLCNRLPAFCKTCLIFQEALAVTKLQHQNHTLKKRCFEICMTVIEASRRTNPKEIMRVMRELDRIFRLEGSPALQPAFLDQTAAISCVGIMQNVRCSTANSKKITYMQNPMF